MQPVVVGVGALPEVEHDAGADEIACGRAELAQCAEVVAGHARGGLDLDADQAAVLALQDGVDFVAVAGAPVAGDSDVVQP